MNSVDNPYFLVEGTDLRSRIEELEGHLASMAGLWSKSDSEKQLLLGRIEQLEAKLAKAVEELENMQKVPRSDASYGILMVMIKYTLAELKGQNDE